MKKKKVCFIITLIICFVLIKQNDYINIIMNIRADKEESNDVQAISNVTVYLNQTTQELINITIDWSNGTTQSFTPQNLSLIINTTALATAIANQSQDQSQNQEQNVFLNLNSDIVSILMIIIMFLGMTLMTYFIICSIRSNNNNKRRHRRK